MKLTGAKGTVVATYTYGTYGELLSGDTTLTRYLYNGRCGVTTDDNGLYYMRQRYYNPEIKRFVNQDILTGSLDNSQSLNRYSYVQGNPVSYTDPFGLSPINGLFSGTDGAHLILGLLGCVPVVGWVFDLADAAIYAFVDHDYGMAAISMLGVVFDGAPLIVGAGALAIGKVGARAGDFVGAGKNIFKTMSSKIVDGISSMSSPVMKGVHKLGDIGSTIKTTAKQGIDKIYSGAKNVAKQGRDKVASMFKKGGGYQGGSGSRNRKGNPINPMDKTYEMALNPELYANEVAKKYGINLKGSGQKVDILFNPELKSAGKTRKVAPNVIELGPSAFVSEEELSNTIAHELNHARSFIKGGDAPEKGITGAYHAGDTLAEYIRGER